MSDTPRTDAAEKECIYDSQLLAHARALERELAEARTLLAVTESEYDKTNDELTAVIADRDALLGELHALQRSIVDLSHPNCRTLLEERDKWKASHDNQVNLRRMLMDRPDLKDRARRISEVISALRQCREALATCRGGVEAIQAADKALVGKHD